jgi:3-oxoacyl-[acyl-carrier protein] reductase
MTLSNASILVTGGGSGLGEGMARHFASQGARVTLSGRRADKVQAVAASIGPAARAVVGDVTNAADREAMVAAALEQGAGRLDALINNAGNMYRGPISQLDEQALLDVFHTNVVGAMLLTGLATPHLAQTKGSVIFIGSVHTRRAYPGASPYAATKGAVQALTRVLAAELGGQGIRVNCVIPGAVHTEINTRAGLFDMETAKARLDGMAGHHALGRIGSAEEIAQAIGHLLEQPWTTGALLDVDGGLGLGLTNA